MRKQLQEYEEQGGVTSSLNERELSKQIKKLTS